MTGRSLDVDVAVIGAGFGGALTALALRRLGRSVVLVERGRHPRFAIGESSTPLANILIEELAAKYDLPRVAPLAKWGTWRAAYPDLPVGLKRGFSFFHHALDRPFDDDGSHARQLLVGASPHDAIADTHWYRPAFDEFLTHEAQEAGAELLDQTRIDRIRLEGRCRAPRSHPRRHHAHADRALRRRCQRSTWGAPSAARARGSADPVAARDRRALHALRGRRALGRGGAARGRRAVSGGRRGGASGVSWRVDLDSAIQQRHHERRCRRDDDAGAAVEAGGGRGRVAPAARSAAVGEGAVCRGARDAAVHARPACRVSQPRHVRRWLGDAAVGGRGHRPAAVDRLSADPARSRAARRSARAHVERTRA